jgi:hypothetical protein
MDADADPDTPSTLNNRWAGKEFGAIEFKVVVLIERPALELGVFWRALAKGRIANLALTCRALVRMTFPRE